VQTNGSELLENRLVEAIRARVDGCLAVYRFGSWGTLDQRSDSDIDLAVLAPAPLDPVARWDLAQQLASLAGRDVDLVDLHKASTVLRYQVIAYGERLFSADAATVERFEDQVFSRYVRFNEARSAILEDVKKRGSIYGK